MGGSEGIVAFDITKKFRAAAGTLELGELVKDDFFSLFESVGALEIMDPKMDSGCLAPGESLDEDYDVTRPLSPGEVIGIIDQLFCLEMAWYQGYPLSQTLLTNVYIDRMLEPEPLILQDADFIRERIAKEQRDPMHVVLRAYCLGLVKCCWYINDRIKFEHYYEEEDFVTNTYHRSLLDSFDLNDINDEIMAARRLVHSIRHRIGNELAQALGFRLELRTAFLRAIELSVMRSNPESLSLPWTQMKAVWEMIYQSRHLGQPVPEAFSTKIQRRLASTMPPRPIVKLSTEETYKHFKKLFVDGINVLNVLNYHDSQSLLVLTYHQNFVMTFQSQKPQPLVYIRTLLQSFLFKDMIILGKLSIRHVLDDDLSLVVLPASKFLDPANDLVEAPHHPRYALAHQMELFRQRAAQSYLDIFRAFCQNRCRIRRTLCHSIQDWETVQVDAEEIDQLLRLQIDEKPHVYPPTGDEDTSGVEPTYSLPLSSWAYLYKLRLMEWIVQLGFELDIYAPDELAGMYWYLSDLARHRARLVDRISYFTKLRAAEEKGGATAAQEAAFIRSKHYLYQASFDAAITWEMADAMSNMYAALGRLGLIVPPPRPYSTDELRYDVRMKPFGTIGLPELPSWEVYRASTDRAQVETEKLLEDARLSLEQAQRGLEVVARMSEKESFSVGCYERWLGGVTGQIRAVEKAGVVVEVVMRKLEEKGEGTKGKELGLKVGIGKAAEGEHEWWVVPTVEEIDQRA
ncbi:putative MAK10 subunit [Triangularia verruculosa]|uniref:MAK10 subunit n=1 Tax=Triangularia verruculosa TaxID=2587418 RepID=A0AAN7AZW6_9PEZI|nr:putative MAK10 subunit [Triangularia verruculosa]